VRVADLPSVRSCGAGEIEYIRRPELPNGTVVALTGDSSSGKSTLATAWARDVTIPVRSHVVPSAATFTHESEAVRQPELKKFIRQIRSFFKSFESLNFKDLSVAHIQNLVDAHGLSIPALLGDYSKKLKNVN
jgi:ABC-type phosphate/phosphonate transport system ATPase subunit